MSINRHQLAFPCWWDRLDWIHSVNSFTGSNVKCESIRESVWRPIPNWVEWATLYGRVARLRSISSQFPLMSISRFAWFDWNFNHFHGISVKFVQFSLNFNQIGIVFMKFWSISSIFIQILPWFQSFSLNFNQIGIVFMKFWSISSIFIQIFPWFQSF